ncbi:hypothetical protein BGX26_002274 [Mortierella sp. AD094]|nr:hypothetical protein BGX26_002274 [Mortierella sp. AD094]
MLVANDGTRPDGAWFFTDRRYAGSLAIKLYSDRMKQSTHEWCEGESILGRHSTRLCASGTPSNLKGTLRIHLEFPGVQGGNPVTHVKKVVKKDPVTGVDVTEIEDVMNKEKRHVGQGRVGQGKATQRNATQRNATQRNGTQRNETDRNGRQHKATQRETKR